MIFLAGLQLKTTIPTASHAKRLILFIFILYQLEDGS